MKTPSNIRRRPSITAPYATTLLIGLVIAPLHAVDITGDTVTGDLTVQGDTIRMDDGTNQFELRNGANRFDFWHDAPGQWVWSHGATPTDVMSLDSTNNLSLYDLGAASANPSIVLSPGNPDATPAVLPSITIGGSPVLTAAGAAGILDSQGYVRVLGGTLHLPSTTASSSSITGALTVAGGIGVAGDSWISGIRIGKGAGGVNTNTGIGVGVLSDNTSGGNNTATGAHALARNTIGTNNSSFGAYSQQFGTSGSGNSAFGSLTLRDNVAQNNTAIGSRALFRKTYGANNVAVGYAAGDLQLGGTFLNNAIDCVFLGANTRGKVNGDQNAIVIGANAVSEGSNTTVIGNDATVSTRLRGETNVAALRVAGDVIIDQPQGDISMGAYQ